MNSSFCISYFKRFLKSQANICRTEDRETTDISQIYTSLLNITLKNILAFANDILHSGKFHRADRMKCDRISTIFFLNPGTDGEEKINHS